jgi:hypothetical protein
MPGEVSGKQLPYQSQHTNPPINLYIDIGKKIERSHFTEKNRIF